MGFNASVDWVPNLEDAIVRDPLCVKPDTPLVDAIALISQAHSQPCLLNEEGTSSDRAFKPVRVSSVLAIEERTLVGILTERDVVRLTAQAIDFQAATVADVMVHPVISFPERSLKDIFAALFLFRRYRIRHLPIVDEQDRLIGVISHESIRQVMRPANLLRFSRVSDVMAHEVIHADLLTNILQLAELMASHRVSCIVITQTDGELNPQPVGIVTERDIVQFQALQINLATTEAKTVMSSPLYLLSPEDSLWTAYQEMQKRRVGRLVVSWNWGQGLGLVTQTSLLRVFDPMEMYGVIENLQQTIEQLEVKLTKELPSKQSIETEMQPENSPPPQGLLTSNFSSASKPRVGEGDVFLSLLDSIHASITQLLENPNISMNQWRLRLTSVLDTIEQMYGEIK